MYKKSISKNIKLIIDFLTRHKITLIVVAISGGQDSITLIKLLERIKKFYNIVLKVSYIYVDHQWKKTSNIQTKQIINYISSRKSEIIVYQIKNNTKSEDNCRKQRYHIMIQHSLRHNHQLVITGHNKTDKIETFFQNIYRGCGIEGMNSLITKNRLSNNIFILRPLLNLDKNQIYWLCKKMDLPIWSDNTNYLYSVQRNRFRHELLPYINNFCSTEIKSNIGYFTKLYYYENEYIKQNCIKLYLKIKHKSRIAINHKILKKHHVVLQKRIIQLFIFHNFHLNTDNKKIIRIIRQINQQSEKKKMVTRYKRITYFMNHEWIYVKIK